MERAQQSSAKLIDEELIKCGEGTEFSLDEGPDGTRCLGVAAEADNKTALALFKIAGIIFQWRVYVDKTDGTI